MKSSVTKTVEFRGNRVTLTWQYIESTRDESKEILSLGRLGLGYSSVINQSLKSRSPKPNLYHINQSVNQQIDVGIAQSIRYFLASTRIGVQTHNLLQNKRKKKQVR